MCEADFKFSFIKIVISEMYSILEQIWWKGGSRELILKLRLNLWTITPNALSIYEYLYQIFKRDISLISQRKCQFLLARFSKPCSTRSYVFTQQLIT